MPNPPVDPVVTDNPAQERFEIHVGASLAGIEEYTVDGNVYSFNHTEIYPQHEGFGLAAILVSRALDDLRSRGAKVRPVCPYVVKFLGKHPEYQDLIS
ncbi:putative GNAT family acetyltransferase [Rhodococcus sp. 27YEA15]|uniref:GNAT family N-acetyltransferase n=1 Tax=Rhodococcus sp. 27YEA15 TaxID=3156259 RepID=UPI003C7B58F7